MKPLSMKRILGGSVLIIFGTIEIYVFNKAYGHQLDDYSLFMIFCFFLLVVAPIYMGIATLCNFSMLLYIKTKIQKRKVSRKGSAASQRDLEKQLFKVAYAHGGAVTVVDVTLHTELSLEEAQLALENMVKRSYVKLKIAENGTMLYQFLGILADEEKKADPTFDDLL